jgi:hypothetical protein
MIALADEDLIGLCGFACYADFILAGSAASSGYRLLLGIIRRRRLARLGETGLCAADDGAHAHGFADGPGGRHRGDCRADFARELRPVSGWDLVC